LFQILFFDSVGILRAIFFFLRVWEKINNTRKYLRMYHNHSNIKQLIRQLHGWEEREGTFLVKVFSFETFVDALSFVCRVGDVAEEQQHHPDIRIFEYNKVEILLTTHSEKNLTIKDVAVAEKIDAIMK
jgi:4a-hydroxytetrahydrobiopterin dehydratase